MAVSEIHTKLLSPEGMQRVRAAIVSQCQFLVHCAPQDRVPSILVTGLRPSNPGTAMDADMECVKRCLGTDYPRIVCFTPPKHRIKLGLVEFAIATVDLPERVGIDWSFSGYWRWIDDARQKNPDETLEQIVLRAFGVFRSIVTYDLVPSSALRVRVLNSTVDPYTWPLFRTVSNHHELFVDRGIPL